MSETASGRMGGRASYCQGARIRELLNEVSNEGSCRTLTGLTSRQWFAWPDPFFASWWSR